MRARRFTLGIVVCLLLSSACQRQTHRDRFACENLEDATQAKIFVIEGVAHALENANTESALAHVKAYLHTTTAPLERCTRMVEQSFQNMPSEDVLIYHEQFIQDPRVKALLDKQDIFQEHATPEQVEALNTLLNPLLLLAE
ncbi:MAG: hypothetical protein FWC40_08780 [Proteobacteria bacterium]|nr:hypothetical protein [Pseudomonadota bacterium]